MSTDVLAVEAPLQLSLNGRRYAVLMRTPDTHVSSDLDLCVGFLFSEGVIEDIDDLASIDYCSDPRNQQALHSIVAHLHGSSGLPDVLRTKQRSTTVGSACGLCGRMDVSTLLPPLPERKRYPKPNEAFVCALPQRLRSRQTLFEQTGGLHGAALFDAHGQCLHSAEDVGRHNAVDKVIGNRLRQAPTQLDGSILVVSSRLSFELVQKALMARVSSLVGVGAASDLAHNTAREHGLHMFSFTRAESTNYHGPFVT